MNKYWIRATDDVDLIVRTAALKDYHRVERALTSRGFVHDVSSTAPICRWRIGSAVVDVMPTLAAILGFSDRWYPLFVNTASRHRCRRDCFHRASTSPGVVEDAEIERGIPKL